MPFVAAPILDMMIRLYEKPRSIERFREYLKILQGDSKDDMMVPVGNFNPMGKEHVLEKLNELKRLGAEELLYKTVQELNKSTNPAAELNVSLSLADDLKGAWTNRFTTDYDSRFKLNALVTRNFCTVLFWTSEAYSETIIEERIREYCYRTLYWLEHSKPCTLEEHILQEAWVAQKSGLRRGNSNQELMNAFYEKWKGTDRYDIIFNFLYGDDACNQLGFPVFGISEPFAGYKYATALKD